MAARHGLGDGRITPSQQARPEVGELDDRGGGGGPEPLGHEGGDGLAAAADVRERAFGLPTTTVVRSSTQNSRRLSRKCS